jgi:hypothetical protein
MESARSIFLRRLEHDFCLLKPIFNLFLSIKWVSVADTIQEENLNGRKKKRSNQTSGKKTKNNPVSKRKGLGSSSIAIRKKTKINADSLRPGGGGSHHPPRATRVPPLPPAAGRAGSDLSFNSSTIPPPPPTIRSSGRPLLVSPAESLRDSSVIPAYYEDAISKQEEGNHRNVNLTPRIQEDDSDSLFGSSSWFSTSDSYDGAHSSPPSVCSSINFKSSFSDTARNLTSDDDNAFFTSILDTKGVTREEGGDCCSLSSITHCLSSWRTKNSPSLLLPKAYLMNRFRLSPPVIEDDEEK